LPDDLADALAREARRRRMPVSAVVREGIAALLGPADGKRQITFAAIGRSGHHDVARRVDEILEREWTDAGDR